MKKISYKIKNLELRNYVPESKRTPLEIVKWENNKVCLSIAFFRKYKEGHYLESVGDRIIPSDGDWEIFGRLITEGFDFLERNMEDKE